MRKLKRTTRQSITRERLVELARPAVGLPVSYSWRGIGSALFLELGRLRRVPAVRPTKAEPWAAHPMGEVGIMIEWSWRVERARSIEVGSWSTERRLDAGIARLAGPCVTAIDVTGRLPELVLALSDGRWVHAFMTADGQPQWTVFLQDGSWLSVERGRLIHDVQNRKSGRKHRSHSD